VLSAYKISIQKTIYERKEYLHNIFEIDTSKKDQNEVGKEVTEKTLESLKELLEERIGFFTPRTEDINKLKSERWFDFETTKRLLGEINFDSREIVEGDDKKLQPIPIVVITDSDHRKVLGVKK